MGREGKEGGGCLYMSRLGCRCLESSHGGGGPSDGTVALGIAHPLFPLACAVVLPLRAGAVSRCMHKILRTHTASTVPGFSSGDRRERWAFNPSNPFLDALQRMAASHVVLTAVVGRSLT